MVCVPAVDPHRGRPSRAGEQSWAAACLAVLSAGSVAASATSQSTIPELATRLDALHPRRDEPAALDEADRLAEAALGAAPSDYDVLWRAARVRFTQSDQPRGPSERSRLGKEAYELAERAIAVNPNDVAGHYWAALGIGSYAQGMGILRALATASRGSSGTRSSARPRST